MNKPLVSIGMPTFNGERFLARSLDSLLGQSYQNIELVISDNASTDDTAKICKRYKAKDSRVRYVRQKEMISPPDNFNFVFNQSKGSYFMWAADDDLWDKRFIERLMQTFSSLNDESIALVTPRYHVIDFDGRERLDRRYAFPDKDTSELSFLEYLQESFYTYKGTHFLGMYRRKYLSLIPGLVADATLAAVDIFTLHKIFTLGKVVILDEVLFYKREQVYADRLTGSSGATFIQNWLNFFLKILSNLLPHNFVWIFSRALQYFTFNQKLIWNNYRQNILSYTLWNILSSIQFYLLFLPVSVQDLKVREVRYSR